MILFRFILISLLFINISFAADEKAGDQELKSDYISKIAEIDDELKKNIWFKRYSNYQTYRKIEKELVQIKKDIKKYSSWRGEKYKELAYQLSNKAKIKENELKLIGEYKDSPIGSSIKPLEIDKKPDISNPFVIIEALSYIKKLQENRVAYKEINQELSQLLGLIEQKYTYLKEYLKLDDKDKDLKKMLSELEQERKDFIMVVDIVSTTDEVYGKKIEEIILEVEEDISEEFNKLFKLSIIILILVLISFLIKLGFRKYLTDKDDDQHYTANKLLNFILFVLVTIVILSSYIANASYLVTVLGFASAGIAIALKDWFMSIFGWIAIMTSGAIHVGDRIKVTKDGTEAVGDVIDISLFKISIREDITLTSYMTNRRTGRVFFIPNNYIFTDLIANYTYDGLRTVWDGIDINITFDSNHKKAVHIAKEITKQYSKGYTEITRKTLSKLRSKYVLRSTGVEPRVFSFIEPYGVRVSAWYLTNSYATLALRSTISSEILEAYKEADDIKLAYPTQTLRVASSSEAEMLLPGTTAQGVFDGPPSS